MSTYYQIFGGKVNVVSADPSNPIEGQMWYNTTTEVLKYRVGLIPAAWSSGGNLGSPRNTLAGAGTQTAGLGFGGSGYVANTEEYDGSAWTAGGNLGTARRYLAGAGTQTAGLGFGGFVTAVSNATEEYSEGNATKTFTTS